MAAKTVPVVLVCCGSFNPITNAHIEMIKTARHSVENSAFADGAIRKVAHAFISPVNDAYKKPGLAPFPIRKQICDAALSTPENSWISLHPWEGQQQQFVPTYVVMKEIYEELKKSKSVTPTGGDDFEQYLVCGCDLLESFYKPGAWGLANLEKLLQEFKLIVMAREGSVDPRKVIEDGVVISHEKFPGVEIDVRQYIKNFIFSSLKPNSTSSTLVRTTLKEEGIEGLRKLGIVPEPALEILAKQDFYELKNDNEKTEEK